MAPLRSRRSERRSSRVWWRCGRDERYSAALNVGARKSERGRAVGKGRGVSSSSLSSEAPEVAVEGDEGRVNARVPLRGRLGMGTVRFG